MSFMTAPTETSAADTGSTETKPLDLSDYKELPVLSIQTVSQESNVMDFITKPVAAHVAEQIATWTPGYVMPPAPYYETCKISLTDPDQNLLLADAEAEVKVRGNWTTNYPKKPLRLKFTEKQNLLGMHDGAAFRNWLLLAAYKDASLLRDRTALSIAREILGADGLYASDAQFAEVFVNQEYWGVYLLAEQQQVNPERIAITEVQPEDTGTNIGYLMEFDGYYYNEDPLHQFHVEYADNAPLTPFDGEGGNEKTMSCLPKNSSDPKRDVGITIKSQINTQEQHDFIASYLNHVYEIMYAAAYENKAMVFNDAFTEISEDTSISPQEAVEQAVDVQSLADMYIISELTCDADLYWSSFYMDVDFGEGGSKKLRFEAPWDFDSAMGNKMRCEDGTGFYAANLIPDVDCGPDYKGNYETINPWLAVLMYEDWYQDVIRETWKKAYESGVFRKAHDMILQETKDYQNAFARNYEKWDNIRNNADFYQELSRSARKCKDQEQAAEYLADWLEKRTAFLNDYWGSN
ncbi:MAG TPA: spore coat protein CotH [Ruminococcus sp.]|nr:spore coat protein CotH [Ruminococcus sp.]